MADFIARGSDKIATKQQTGTVDQAHAEAMVLLTADRDGTVLEPLTDAELRATPIPVSGTVTATGGLTDTELRAAPVPVADGGGSLTVDGPVTDTQLRATPVPVSGTVTANVGTGTQPVSGTVTANAGTGPFPVSDNGGSLTIDATSLPLPTGAAAEHATAGSPHSARLSDGGAFYKATTPSDTQPVSAASLPLPTGAATAAKQPALGSPGSPSTDVITVQGSGSGTVLPVGDGGGSLTVDGTVAVSGTVAVTDNAGSLTVDNAGTFAVQDSQVVTDNAAFTDGTTKVQPAGYIFDEVAGTALTENDTAAARIDSKRAQVGVLEDATTRGQRAAISAGGALKVDGSAVTQPVSGTVTANAGTGPFPVSDNGGSLTVDNAGTFAVQSAAAGIAAHDAAVSGNPVLGAGRASAAAPSDVSADGDVVTAWLLRNGAQATVVTAAGALVGGDATNGLDVDVTRLPALAAGTNVIGNVGLAAAAGAAGLSSYAVLSAATDNAAVIKTQAGKLHGYFLKNRSAAEVVVKLYNKATSPTSGDTPIRRISLEAGQAANVNTDIGIAFSAGIGIRIVTGIADNNTTAVAANDVVVNIDYI